MSTYIYVPHTLQCESPVPYVVHTAVHYTRTYMEMRVIYSHEDEDDFNMVCCIIKLLTGCELCCMLLLFPYITDTRQQLQLCCGVASAEGRPGIKNGAGLWQVLFTTYF